MSGFHGQFVWCELMTTDREAAAAFYGRVIGWAASDSGMPGEPYTLLGVDGVHVAGVGKMPEGALEAGARPGWVGYIGSRDVDADVGRATAAGSVLRHGPGDIPGVGRFARMTDPQGAVFVLFTPATPGPARPGASLAAGHVGWHELHAADHAAAFAFYSGLFGWTKGDPIDMGPMGIYQLFEQGGMAVGGMMNKMDFMPRPVWFYYFNVPGIDAAIERVKVGGGQLLNGPHEVPGGMWTAQCLDPQGLNFAMVAPGR